MNSANDRILALDTVRGVAVMGILLLNIVAFALPLPAYFNPAAYGGSTGADLVAWLVNFTFFDGRMRGLFSFLFGASMLLVIDRAEAKHESPAAVHYARMVWLLVFGLIHMWLIWWGDILTQYALVGMIAYLFRNKRVAQLIGLGVVLIVLQQLVTLSIPMLVLKTQTNPADTATVEQALAFQQTFGVPSATWLAEQVALHRGDWTTLTVQRFAEAQLMPLIALLQYGWETLAYMLFGMAALRSGMLTGQWDRARYRRWAAIGFGVTVPFYAIIAAWIVSQQFSLFSVTAGAMAAPVIFRPLAILGWASLIILAMRPGGPLTIRVAAAGRMAFTNYLGTSLICTTLFYGHGLGWFGQLSRAEIYLVVAAICAGMLIWSKAWLDRFAYGPLEWLWRTLSRASWQPLSKPIIANATQ